MQLMTIGYEGLTTQQFFSALLINKVQTIVDVRELPLSRKPGFSKASLALAADRYGLSYTHMAALGCPKEIRHGYRADGDWARYTRRYKVYLQTQSEAINELAAMVRKKRCCLLCFEADHHFCHRTYVAERVVARLHHLIAVAHLTAPNPAKVASLRPALA